MSDLSVCLVQCLILCLCLCISVRPQMDALCDGVKKPEGSDPIVDPRPPPAKLARLEQNGAGPSAQERSRQGSPVAKNPCLAQKPTTVRPQSKSWHSKGTRADMGFREWT